MKVLIADDHPFVRRGVTQVLTDEFPGVVIGEASTAPELLEQACAEAGIPLTLRRQAGYDHSYYFISSFMTDHIRWHAERLNR